MKKLISFLFSLVFTLFIAACNSTKKVEQADLVIHGGTIYTVDDANPLVESVAIKGDRILFAGSLEEAQSYIGEATEQLDLKGKTMTPGLIEGHGHIMGLGYNELNIDLLEVGSYDELIIKVEEAVGKTEPGQWIIGRGWHQSKWNNENEKMVKGFPTHDKLSAVSPDNPVYLSHASGHMGLANQRAMEISGVLQMSKESIGGSEVQGGEIIRDELGNPTGIFNERAQTLIGDNIPRTTAEKDKQALELAIKACLRNGITGFHDAGASRESIGLFKEFRQTGKLDLRLYVMLTGWDKDLLEEWYVKGPEIDTSENKLTIRSVKLNCDGALGSRGAWLLKEYADQPGHYGHETLPMDFVLETSRKALKNGFQVCSHAIGDRANREILDRYEIAFKENGQDSSLARFRIEHAQHLHPDDIPRFAQLGVIPAMQAIHMSSDRPWAIKRLGEQRIVEGAYVWQKLLQSGVPIVNGTDTPVEPINPLASFYASVTRKTLKGMPEEGYEPDQKMTRAQALKSYTLDAAYGAFEESIKGSIEVNKLADFTIFDKDIMKVPDKDILEISVEMTVLGGKVMYTKP